jgi:hypothetical protein
MRSACTWALLGNLERLDHAPGHLNDPWARCLSMIEAGAARVDRLEPV